MNALNVLVVVGIVIASLILIALFMVASFSAIVSVVKKAKLLFQLERTMSGELQRDRENAIRIAFLAIFKKIESEAPKIPPEKLVRFGELKGWLVKVDWKDMEKVREFASSFRSFYDNKLPRLIDDELDDSLHLLITEEEPVFEIKSVEDFFDAQRNFEKLSERRNFIKDAAEKMIK